MITNRIKWIYQRYIWWSENERHIAKRLLESISRKLWITDSELFMFIEEEQETKKEFKVPQEYLKLFTQIVFKVTNKKDIYWNEELTKVTVSTNERRAWEIRKQFWFYKTQYDKEIDRMKQRHTEEMNLLLETYIFKHSLFWTQKTDLKDLTPEQIDRQMDISAMLDSLEDIDYEWSDRLLDN